MRISSIIFVILPVFLFTGCVGLVNDFQAKKGVIDLTSWNPDSRTIISLEGEWEFYWKKLLQPEDFQKPAANPATYIAVPAIWRNLKMDDKPLSQNGFGTYRLKIKIPEPDRNYAIRIHTLIGAYKLWVNGKFIVEVGKVSTKPDEFKPSYTSNEYHIFMKNKDTEIILQIANQDNILGGFWVPVSFGLSERIDTYRDFLISLDNFMLGLLFLTSIYFLSLYFVRKVEKGNLLFSLLAFAMAFRILSLGEQRLLFQLFEHATYLAYRLNHTSFYIAGALLFAFVFHIYPNKKFRIAYNVTRVLLYLIPASIMTIPILWIGILTMPFVIISFIFVILSVILFVNAAIQKKEGVSLFLLSIVVLLIPFINDILNLSNIISTGYFAGYGVTGLVVIQSIILFGRFGVAFNKLEILTVQLKDARDNLELKVIDRTAELKDAYEKVNVAYKDAETANLRKSKFLASMSHELRTPLNAINGIVDLLRFGSYERDEEILEAFQSLLEQLNQERETNGEIASLTKEIKEQMEFIADDGNYKRYYLIILRKKLKNLSLEDKAEIKQALENLQNHINGEERDIFHSYKRIKESGDYLLGLIDSVLNLSKVEAGKVEIKKTKITTREWIDSISHNIRNYTDVKGKKHLEIKIVIPEDVPKTLFLDDQKTKQVLFNLLSNAVKFTENGSVELMVRREQDHILFSVKDTGLGIRDQEKEKIFVEFERTDVTKNIEGTGLGLAVSKRLVNLHGGKMGFESEYGKGSTFWFSLPMNE